MTAGYAEESAANLERAEQSWQAAQELAVPWACRNACANAR